MKKKNQIFQALLGVSATIVTALIAMGRLTWSKMKKWWKSRSTIHKDIVCSLLVVFVVLIFLSKLIATITSFVKSEFGRIPDFDEKISENISLHAFAKNKSRLYNNKTKKYTTYRFNWLSDVSENDSLAAYSLPNRRGFINVNTGEIIIDAKKNNYRKAWMFSEGLAAVVKGDKMGFINAQNEAIIPFQFPYSSKIYAMNYMFKNGLCLINNEEGKLGLIDKTGKWVAEPIYEVILDTKIKGYKIVINDDKYGLLDSLGMQVYPVEYSFISVASDGFVLTKDGRMWQEDFSGEVMLPFMFERTFYLNYPIGYNEQGWISYVFANYLKYEIEGRYGIMNRITGEPITLAIYSNINMLSKELFEVREHDGYYLLDTNGNLVED